MAKLSHPATRIPQTHPSPALQCQRCRAAFTLVELLVVIGVVGLLLGAAIPVGIRALEKARSTQCLGNLRQIGVALNAYLGDHDLRLPTLQAARASARDGSTDTIEQVLAEYAGDPAVFRCPSDPQVWKATGTSYYWNSALNGQSLAAINFLGLTQQVTTIPVLGDKEGWHRGGKSKVNILYADGHTERGLNLGFDD